MKELDQYFVAREDIKMTGEPKPSLEGEEIRLIFLLCLMLQSRLLVQYKNPKAVALVEWLIKKGAENYRRNTYDL